MSVTSSLPWEWPQEQIDNGSSVKIWVLSRLNDVHLSHTNRSSLIYTLIYRPY